MREKVKKKTHWGFTAQFILIDTIFSFPIGLICQFHICPPVVQFSFMWTFKGKIVLQCAVSILEINFIPHVNIKVFYCLFFD